MSRNKYRVPQSPTLPQPQAIASTVPGANHKKLWSMVALYVTAIGGAVFIYTNQMKNVKKLLWYIKDKFDSSMIAWDYFNAINEGKLAAREEAREFGRSSVSQDQLEKAEAYGKAQRIKESIEEGRASVNATEVRKQKAQGYAEKIAELKEQGRKEVSLQETANAIEQGKQEELKVFFKKGAESVSEDEANTSKKQGAEAQIARYMKEGKEIIDEKKDDYIKQGKIAEFILLCKKALKVEQDENDQGNNYEEPKNDVQGATADEDDEY